MHKYWSKYASQSISLKVNSLSLSLFLFLWWSPDFSDHASLQLSAIVHLYKLCLLYRCDCYTLFLDPCCSSIVDFFLPLLFPSICPANANFSRLSLQRKRLAKEMHLSHFHVPKKPSIHIDSWNMKGITIIFNLVTKRSAIVYEYRRVRKFDLNDIAVAVSRGSISKKNQALWKAIFRTHHWKRKIHSGLISLSSSHRFKQKIFYNQDARTT